MGLYTFFYYTRRKETGCFRKAHLRYFFEARCDEGKSVEFLMPY